MAFRWQADRNQRLCVYWAFTYQKSCTDQILRKVEKSFILFTRMAKFPFNNITFTQQLHNECLLVGSPYNCDFGETFQILSIVLSYVLKLDINKVRLFVLDMQVYFLEKVINPLSVIHSFLNLS